MLEEREIGEVLRKKGWKLATAESCTGGLLAQIITSVPGASDYFERGFITYSNDSKVELLGVSKESIEKHGAVSKEVALEMAEGALKNSKAQVSVSITGIAGPTGGSKEKPVGTVFIACKTPQSLVVEHYLFDGTREEIRLKSAKAGLELLWKELIKP